VAPCVKGQHLGDLRQVVVLPMNPGLAQASQVAPALADKGEALRQ
jgi:hypothetical protein